MGGKSCSEIVLGGSYIVCFMGPGKGSLTAGGFVKTLTSKLSSKGVTCN